MPVPVRWWHPAARRGWLPVLHRSKSAGGHQLPGHTMPSSPVQMPGWRVPGCCLELRQLPGQLKQVLPACVPPALSLQSTGWKSMPGCAPALPKIDHCWGPSGQQAGMLQWRRSGFRHQTGLELPVRRSPASAWVWRLPQRGTPPRCWLSLSGYPAGRTGQESTMPAESKQPPGGSDWAPCGRGNGLDHAAHTSGNTLVRSLLIPWRGGGDQAGLLGTNIDDFLGIVHRNIIRADVL